MRESEILLSQVIARPDWDGPRLIYADWLGERHDPRGEFIRVQCALARLPAADDRRAGLRDRADELLKLHQDDWAGPLKGLGSRWPLPPGFTDTVYIAPPRF